MLFVHKQQHKTYDTARATGVHVEMPHFCVSSVAIIPSYFTRNMLKNYNVKNVRSLFLFLRITCAHHMRAHICTHEHTPACARARTHTHTHTGLGVFSLKHYLSGPANTPVKVGFQNASGERFEVTLTRAVGLYVCIFVCAYLRRNTSACARI
jgi:hypothetical protein